MYKLIIGNFILLSSVLASAQTSPVKLSYTVSSKQLQFLSIQKLGLRAALAGDPDFELPIVDKVRNTACLSLKTNGLYKIADAINGHIIYLEEGDSVYIKLTELRNLDKLQTKNNYLPYFNTLTAYGRYAWHYTFFDELYKRTNKLYPGQKTKIVKNPMLFKNTCDKARSVGRKLIDSLYKNKLISYNFKNVALQEINAIYVSWMCTPFSWLERKKIPISYFEKLNTLKFTDSVYAIQCKDYIQAGALFTYYIHNSFNPRNRYANLKFEINSIVQNFSGIIKDKLLAWQIEDYIGHNNPDFDSCYQIFLSECKTTKLKNEIIKKVNAYIKPLKNLSALSLKDLLALTKVQDLTNNRKTLQSICNDSIITLIDCWASWCVPCIDQMPFIHEFEKKYKRRLNIIYLSFDKDEDKWKTFLTKHKLNINHYLIDNDFSSRFSQYFNLESIPRYILISQKGIEVLNVNMPLPSLQEEFESALKKYL